jgi:hypothetical protein
MRNQLQDDWWDSIVLFSWKGESANIKARSVDLSTNATDWLIDWLIDWEMEKWRNDKQGINDYRRVEWKDGMNEWNKRRVGISATDKHQNNNQLNHKGNLHLGGSEFIRIHQDLAKKSQEETRK